MKIVFFGTGPFGLPALDALKKHPSQPLVSIVTSPDRPRGRDLKSQPSLVKEWAEKAGIPVLSFEKPNAPESRVVLEKLNADLFVVIAYGYLLSPQTLAIPRHGAWNVHSSLLPRYRGPAPIHWALLNGDAETGVTVMRMLEKLDAGDILIQKKTPVRPDDNYETLERRLAELGVSALTEALDALQGGRAPAPHPQDEKSTSYARKITKDDGKIDWKRPAKQIHSQIRALVRWPKACSFYQGKRILILDAQPVSSQGAPGEPGTVLKASPQEGLWVAAGDSALEIKTLQAEGKRAMDAKEFLKGFAISPESRFE